MMYMVRIFDIGLILKGNSFLEWLPLTLMFYCLFMYNDYVNGASMIIRFEMLYLTRLIACFKVLFVFESSN